LVEAFFAFAPSAKPSFANTEDEIAALAFRLALQDGASLTG
jgi:hypothetical protein